MLECSVLTSAGYQSLAFGFRAAIGWISASPLAFTLAVALSIFIDDTRCTRCRSVLCPHGNIAREGGSGRLSACFALVSITARHGTVSGSRSSVHVPVA